MFNIKKWNDFLNDRYEINNLPKNIVLLSEIDSNSGTFLLYNINTKKPIGYISFDLYPTINSYTVGGAYSEHGLVPKPPIPNALTISCISCTSLYVFSTINFGVLSNGESYVGFLPYGCSKYSSSSSPITISPST
jgi:hypothetical protein